MFLPNHNFFTQDRGSSVTDWITAISTSLLVIIAFLAFWGEKLLRLIFKPKLSFLKVRDIPQYINKQHEIVIYRLHLKNVALFTAAKNVKATVYSNSGADQKRFIQIPLNWTNIDGRKRDIPAGEEALLDLFQKNSETEYLWCWAHSKSPYEPAISKLSLEGKSNIKISFSDEYSLLDSVTIEFDPKGKTVILYDAQVVNIRG